MLRLDELQRKLRDKTEWALAKVGPPFAAARLLVSELAICMHRLLAASVGCFKHGLL